MSLLLKHELHSIFQLDIINEWVIITEQLHFNSNKISCQIGHNVKCSVDYSRIAAKYDHRYEELSFNGVERELLEFVKGTSVREILEVGCGTGYWLDILDKRGFSVAGLEPSPQMLDLARTRVPNGDLKAGYAHKLPWPDNSFDCLFCVNAIHHFEKKDQFIIEAYRVLRKNSGLLIIGLDPHKRIDQWCIYDYFEGTLKFDLQRYLPASGIEKLMRDAGFFNCSTYEVQHIVMRIPAREAIQRGIVDKTIVSQLGALSEEQYNRGIQGIWKMIADSEAQGEQSYLVIDLRLYATIGWKT